MRRVIVVGASGFVGQRLHAGLALALGPQVEVRGTGHRRAQGGLEHLDVTDALLVERRLHAWEADAVVWVAGLKDVSGCERDPAAAMALNVHPVEQALAALARGGLPTRLLYLSTDYVFGGPGAPFASDAPRTPRTAYGQSKRLAEDCVIAAGQRHGIVRTAAVMARGGGFLGWLIKALTEPGLISAFHNTYFSPTPISLLVEGVANLLRVPSPSAGQWHVAGARQSRHELARRLAQVLGHDPERIARTAADLHQTTFQADLSLTPSPDLGPLCETWWARLVEEALGDSVR